MPNAPSIVPDSPDCVLTLLVDGEPLLAFQAARMTEAMQLWRDHVLQHDLCRLTSHGIPLWSENRKISVRAARKDEIAIYAGFEEAAITPEGDLVLAFLVDVDE